MLLTCDSRNRYFSQDGSQLHAGKSKAPLCLMPLGGSITYGSGSSHGNGYRELLRDMLVSDGHEVQMVGSRKSGSMKNGSHEGWRGFRIDQICQKAKCSVTKSLPNLFTVNAGSNDCIQDFDLGNVGKRMGEMIEYLWKASPNSTVLLSTLLVTADTAVAPRVLHVNEQLRVLAEQSAAEGKRIVFVEMHGPDGPELGDLVDGTHPCDAGYQKMATIWHRGVQEAESKGWLSGKPL
ncbi:unnamed protein product [Parascedosporium putredinis]|uniref:SGNH hydrolase-type esterase domain-containing protein n=1 Tax=Parascedosporium putredinis TaxID=1442378 RepID=A0A9P1H8V9_9PEZI|nr:unnamed protein product [Parascedosporium putredinis]CAI8000209.1 unnamed protein product [Parascedosporium putredinis]